MSALVEQSSTTNRNFVIFQNVLFVLIGLFCRYSYMYGKIIMYLLKYNKYKAIKKVPHKYKLKISKISSNIDEQNNMLQETVEATCCISVYIPFFTIFLPSGSTIRKPYASTQIR